MSVITAQNVEAASGVLIVGAGDVITPLARDRAKELGVRIERTATGPAPTSNGTQVPKLNGAQVPPAIGIRGLPAVSRSGPLPAERAAAQPRSGALYRRGGGSFASVTPARPKVAVIGAGHVGAATGIRLAESDAFESLTLIDVVDGLAAGLALDMWHSAGLQRFTTRVAGSANLRDVDAADIVIITAGRPRKPGMTRTDLTAANAEIIRAVTGAIRDHAPDAVVVVVTNPLEEMTFLTGKLTGFPPERVIGMGGVLDTARFRSLVALTGIAKAADVGAIVLGSHGAEMVIPLSQAVANGIPLEQLLDAATLDGIVKRTRDSGAEVTGLLKAGSAYVSPGSAIARQVEAIVRGSDEIVPACVVANGVYGLRDVRVGLPVRLGPHGIREIVELPLRPAEVHALRDAADKIRERTRPLA